MSSMYPQARKGFFDWILAILVWGVCIWGTYVLFQILFWGLMLGAGFAACAAILG